MTDNTEKEAGACCSCATEPTKLKKVQKFYFTDAGELIVETNKGIWADGVQYAKMYGNFLCNAKTMGIIISHLRGIKVAVGTKEVVRHSYDEVNDCVPKYREHTIDRYCVLGCGDEYADEYRRAAANDEAVSAARDERDEYYRQMREYEGAYEALRDKVAAHNAKPWYRRIASKIK